MNLLDLPNEMLIKIFDHVDNKSFKNVTISCKKFNEIAGNSKLIKKMKIVLDFPVSGEEFEETFDANSTEILMKSERKFDTLCITNLRYRHLKVKETKERFWKYLESRREDFRSLEIVHCITSFQHMQLLLQPFRNVQEVEVQCSYIQGPRNFDQERPMFQGSLKTLKFYNSDHAFFQLFGQCGEVNSLMIRLVSLTKTNVINKFISQQKNLKNLELANINSCDLFTRRSFKDSSIILENLVMDQAEITDYDCFQEFLSKQKELKCFSFNIPSLSPPGSCDGILKEAVKLPKLEKLDLSLDSYIPSSSLIFDKVRNRNLKSLIVCYPKMESDPYFLINLLKVFPGLEYLELTSTGNQESLNEDTVKLLLNTIKGFRNLIKLKTEF